MFIDPSCDLVSTTKRLLWGKYVNAGQTCVSPDYVMVPEHFKDTFLKVLKETYACSSLTCLAQNSSSVVITQLQRILRQRFPLELHPPHLLKRI